MREGIKDEEEEWKMETLKVELMDDELELSSLLLKEHHHCILKGRKVTVENDLR